MAARFTPEGPSRNHAPWWKRPGLRIAGALLALLVIVGFVLPYFLNADRFGSMLANLIAAQTGRSVTLGKMRIKLLPRVGFAVDGFRMGNPSGFVAGDFVSASEIRGSLAFWPLVLHRQYRITSLELEHPSLLLLDDRSGRNNYTFGPGPSAPTVRQASVFALDASGTAGAPELEVDQLTLRNAQVTYGIVDPGGRALQVANATGFSAVLLHLALQPLRVGEWQAGARLSGTQLTLAGWNGPIRFRDGDVSLHNAVLESSFNIDFGRSTTTAGTLTVPDVENPTIRFDLKTNDLDLPALISGLQAARVVGDFGVVRNAAVLLARDVISGGTSVPAQVPPAVANSTPLAEGHIAAERIRWAPYAAGPATADLRLYPDRLEVWPVTLRLYGGSLQVSARTDRRQTPQRFSANMEARNLNLGQFVDTNPASRGNFAGTGELDLQLFGSLDPAWIKSLAGHGEFAVRNGRIRGLAPPGAMQSMAEFFGLGGDVTFTAITGELNVRDQRISSRDVHFNSPRDTADLAGSLGFDGSLNFDGQLIAQIETAALSTGNNGSASPGALSASLAKNGGKLTLPFALRGTLAQPELGPGRTMLNFSAPASPGAQPSCCSYPNLFHKQ